MTKSTAFWDSSALIPLCVQESTSGQVRALARRFAPVVWWATPVEIHSGIARLYRSGELGESDRQAALNRLGFLSRSWREVLPSDQARTLAVALLDTYSLRAADGLQLAAAMIWCRSEPRNRHFLTADIRLSQAASAIGFHIPFQVRAAT